MTILHASIQVRNKPVFRIVQVSSKHVVMGCLMFWVIVVAGLLALLVARSPRTPPVTMSSRASGLRATRQVGGTGSICRNLTGTSSTRNSLAQLWLPNIRGRLLLMPLKRFLRTLKRWN